MTTYPYPSLVFQQEIQTESIETLSSIRELDNASETIASILDESIGSLLTGGKSNSMSKIQLEEITKLKLATETIAAKKVELAVRLYDFLDLNMKLLDTEIDALEKAILLRGGVLSSTGNSGDGSTSKSNTLPLKRKRGRPRLNPIPEDPLTVVEDTTTTQESSISQNEPLYCTCNRVAFGDMIACDNEDCPVEWFHYPCVNLTKKPRNSWICPLCSNKRKK